MVTAIKIRKKYKDQLELAVKYYTILSALNDFNWTDMEIHLIAFMAIKGNINAGGAKEAFLQWYGSSTKGSVTRLTSVLKLKGILIKDKRKLLLHPELQINPLTEGFVLQLNMFYDKD